MFLSVASFFRSCLSAVCMRWRSLGERAICQFSTHLSPLFSLLFFFLFFLSVIVAPLYFYQLINMTFRPSGNYNVFKVSVTLAPKREKKMCKNILETEESNAVKYCKHLRFTRCVLSLVRLTPLNIYETFLAGDVQRLIRNFQFMFLCIFVYVLFKKNLFVRYAIPSHTIPFSILFLSTWTDFIFELQNDSLSHALIQYFI